MFGLRENGIKKKEEKKEREGKKGRWKLDFS